ncbi:MAG: hypothetical protein ABJI96_21385, partial [Paracoccaceae bacterium]
PESPVWMASALQEQNALIARLVSTVLCSHCPAGDCAAICREGPLIAALVLAAGLDGFRKPVPIGNPTQALLAAGFVQRR